jgi:hypothetical protein
VFGFARIVRIVLYLQVLLAVFVGTAYLLGVSMFGQHGMDARKLTAFFWGLAVLLFLAARRVDDDPRWLWAVIAVVGLNWLDSTYEFLVRGDADFGPPFVIEGILFAVYLTGALTVFRRRPAATNPAGDG